MTAVGQRVRAALAALEQGDVDVHLRKALPPIDETTGSCEVDVQVPGREVERLDEILAAQGFHRFAAPGQPRHRFYLGIEGGRWIKVDAKIRSRGGRATRRAGGQVRWWTRLMRRRPLAVGRRGPVVAVVGPDGAGKGTVIAALEAWIPVATRRIYFGLPVRQSGRAGGAERSAPSSARPRGGWRRRLEPLLVAKGLLRHARTLGRAYAAAWQGRIVLCDRHPLEALAIDPRATRLARAIERAVVSRLFPWPDRVIVLDAPAETMFARKGEHGVERIERWRQSYRRALAGRDTEIVDTAGSVDDATCSASRVVWEALAERRRWSQSVR